MIDKYPELERARIEYEWGVNISRIPLIGRIDGNVYYAQGYAGHGVNMTQVAAEIIVDALCGTMERFDLFEKVHHCRIPLGQRFGNQIVALGMLYYRMRDLL
jgi:glycine/D-amino acid oxidase-like deaminating enzyme